MSKTARIIDVIASNNFQVEWRDLDTDPPSRGMFVELVTDDPNDGKKRAGERMYWSGDRTDQRGLYWRPVPTENFVTGAAPTGTLERPPIDEDFWYVVKCQPQQEVSTVWRLHELRLELYVPIIRRRIPTGRTGRKGHKITRIQPRPMFPGYGLIRRAGVSSIDDLKAVRGVTEVLRDQNREPILLPHDAVLAIFRKQSQKHHEFQQEYPRRFRTQFKLGASVRVASDGNVYDGLLATVEKDDGKGRIEVLLGLIKHTLPADMVVAVS